MPSFSENDSVRRLKGVGPAKEAALARLGIRTVLDLLYHFPRAYEHRGAVRQLKDGVNGECGAFILTVQTVPRQVRTRGGMTLVTFRVSDESGSVEAVFFNQDFIAGQFSVGKKYRFWGSIHRHGDRWQLSSPEYEELCEGVPLPDYVAVYPLTDKLSKKSLQKLMDEALTSVLPFIPDILPESVRIENRLPTLFFALRGIHRPESEEELKLSVKRMMFEELFCLALGISLSKKAHEEIRTDVFLPVKPQPLLSLLPYELTSAQKRAVNDIYRDMTVSGADGKCTPMRRILIGDVGSGKTVCAAIAVFLTASAGRQSALMVPTEILANQHYREMAPLFGKLGFTVKLLTGSTPVKEKKAVYEALSGNGERIDLVIGTHALLNENASFSNAGLIITDEQHRFGVLQRAALQEKCESSHLLVMSATPIPRSLALALYGDLSVSRIDELPAGRQTVETFVVSTDFRPRLERFMRKLVEEGGQVYVVCPSIESDGISVTQDGEVSLDSFFSARTEKTIPLQDATGYAEHLRAVFPDLRTELLHGQMKNAEKDRIMCDFADGKVQILVSTTVIEVGVNVPNATLIVVENAERFGLAQLHQLRGRVGRGKRKSYCVLVSDSKGESAQARLDVMKSCHDGYEIAERDLLLRGPGDFFANSANRGFRQSGGLSLRLASLCSDGDLLSEAFHSASVLLEKDAFLQSKEHSVLLSHLRNLFTFAETTIS